MDETTPKIIELDQAVPVRRLSELLSVPVPKVMQLLLHYGVRATINESVDFETAAVVADELGFKAQSSAITSELKENSIEEGDLKPRPPVVTVMGHVDHGKTKLLDTIRETNIIATESGGITQHIGAYQVNITDDKGKKRLVTFLDTPGHEAFAAMRAHGANITDIVILVVAADDGVKPQTLEAVSHARAAAVPIIVALTKIDKPEADIERTKRQLADIDLLPEEWGGKTIVIPVSSVNGTGIKELLEMILLTADLAEFKASQTAKATGVVIESHLASGIGPVATVLIQQGTLRPGSTLVFRSTYAKIRFMENYLGKRITEATPGQPVRVAGLKAIPEFGELFQEVESEKMAREQNEELRLNRNVRTMKNLGLGELSEAIAVGEVKELNIIVKADTQGSLEAIKNSVVELSTAEVLINIVHEGVGDVSESDINMALASQALIVGFRVNTPPAIRKFASQKGVKVTSYDIIYQLIDDIFDALSGLLEPEIVDVELGKFEVVKIFKTSKTAGIIGGRVNDGTVEKGSQGRVIREGVLVGTLKINRVQREKEAVDKVQAGTECGLLVDSTIAIKTGDILELYKQEERIRRLESPKRNAEVTAKAGVKA